MELLFHDVHGSNIQLENKRTRARRSNSKHFCSAICFSSRPVEIGERVSLKITNTESGYTGHMRFGFTTANSELFRNQALPPYAMPDLVQKPGNWAVPLDGKYGKTDKEISFYVTKTGDVYLSVKDVQDPMQVLSGIDTGCRLWALIDLYGTTSGIELLDTASQIAGEVYGKKQNTGSTTDMELLFHDIHGSNIELEQNKTRARRLNSRQFCNAICFSSRPVEIGERVCLKMTNTDTRFSGHMRFGFTTTNPELFRDQALPRFAMPDLVKKPGNWAIPLDGKYGKTGKEVYFYVTKNGDVYLSVKDVQDPMQVLSGIDTGCRLWALIDLYGNTSGIELLNIASQIAGEVHGKKQKTGFTIYSRSDEVPGTILVLEENTHNEKSHKAEWTTEVEGDPDQVPGRRVAMSANKDLDNYSEERSDFHCSPCFSEENVVEAEGYCADCNEYLCKNCLKYHNKLSATKNHDVLLIENMKNH